MADRHDALRLREFPTDFCQWAFSIPDANRFSPGFQMLVRANIKILGEYSVHWQQPVTDINRHHTVLPAKYVRDRNRLRVLSLARRAAQ